MCVCVLSHSPKQKPLPPPPFSIHHNFLPKKPKTPPFPTPYPYNSPVPTSPAASLPAIPANPARSFFRCVCPSCLSSLLDSPCTGFPRPVYTSLEVAPPRVSVAEVEVLSSLTALSRSTVLGAKVWSSGAVPGGRVWAWNEGMRSLPWRLPGWCWGWWRGDD